MLNHHTSRAVAGGLLLSFCLAGSQAAASPPDAPNRDAPASIPEPPPDAVVDDPYATNAFACRGRAELLAKDVDPDQVRREIEKKVEDARRRDERAARVAEDYCIAAELSARVGSSDASEYYRRAIATAPLDPGYEYLYGHYFRWLRGANASVLEPAERHFYAALKKLEDLQKRGVKREQDDTLINWLQREMQELYQADGLPLLRYKAYPYKSNGLWAPGISAIGRIQVSEDTSDFWHSNEARGFAAEALFAQSSQRLDRPLTRAELYGIIINPLRVDATGKLRIRFNWLGALDLGYDYFYSPQSQITSFFQPDAFNDLKVSTYSVGYNRTFDLYPAFDANVSLQYQWVTRTGFVEFLPLLTENFPTYLATATLGRNFGPDKLTLTGSYVYMDIPDYTTGLIDERKRAESIRAVTLDYAIYRSFILPGADRRTYTRGWHWYGGLAYDDGIWGTRAVEKRDIFAGTSLLGIGRGLTDVTLQGTIATADTTDSRTGPDPEQSFTDVRTNLTFVERIVDDQAPGVVPSALGIFYPANLSVAVPVALDISAQNIDAYNNVRAGVDLWYRDANPVLSAEYLVTVGYSYQYFYVLQRQVNDFHVDFRLGGW
jgi:hypothetical protein